MTHRSDLKQGSLKRILDAAAARLRVEGLAGAGISSVMRDAELTHGAFYAHFADKGMLVEAAFRHALTVARPEWIGTVEDRSWTARLVRLAQVYLQPRHRDVRADGCAFSALGADAARAPEAFRRAFSEELSKSLDAICVASVGESPATASRYDDAIMLMAVCVGGLTLSRAVADSRLSDRILNVCQNAVARLNSPIDDDTDHSLKGRPYDC